MKRLLTQKKGAVLAEFIIAFVPMMNMFFCFTQYAQTAIANLVLRHAATAGARAAIVTYGSCETNQGNEDCASFNPGANIEQGETPERIIRDATVITLAGWADKFDAINIDYRTGTTAGFADPHGIVRVTVRGSYRCDTPLARYIMCAGGHVQMTEYAELPLQGALYKSSAKDNTW